MLGRISLAIVLALGFSAEGRAQVITNPGPEVPTYGVIQPLARQMGMAALGTLNERVGNTLSPSIGLDGTAGWWTPPSGWARVMGEHLDNHYRASTDPEVTGDLLGAQVGVDVWRDRQPSGQGDAVGVYLAYTHSRGDVTSLVTNPSATAYENEPMGTTRLDGYGGGAYWTHLGAGGWYTDAVLQGTHYSGHASTAHAYLPISGEGFVASLEAGYPIAMELGAPFVLEPQAQFVWQHTSFGAKNDGLTEVDLGSSSGVSGRLGVRGQWTIAEDGGSVYQPFLRTNVWRDWSGEVTTTYAGIVQVPVQQQITRIDVAAGLTATIDPRRHFGFYIQIGTRFTLTDSDHRRQDGVWGSGGVRLSW
jgi:outer membrane autotransporter protein